MLALGRSIDTLPVLQRHELRLALKKLRYAADFFAGPLPHKAAKAGIAALAALQDDLGGFNDAASTAAILDAAVAATPEKGRAPVERAALFLKAGLAQGRSRLGARPPELARLCLEKSHSGVKSYSRPCESLPVRTPGVFPLVYACPPAGRPVRRDRGPQDRRSGEVLYRQADPVGPPKIAKKLGEEAVEAVIASLGDDKAHFVAECADVLYHLLVLVAAKDAHLHEVYAELVRRRGRSGLDEKASRKA